MATLAQLAAQMIGEPEFTIQDAIAVMPLEDILKRERLIESGQYNFSTDVDLANYWREKSKNISVDLEDPLRFHTKSETLLNTSIVNEPTPQNWDFDLSLESGEIVLNVNGREKRLKLPETRTVEKTVSGNAVNRKPEQIFIKEDCFQYSVKIGKRPAPHWVFLYDSNGMKCNPQITWTQTHLIIDSNVNLNNHLLLIGV